ncbi:MAG: alpha/beta hydrolase [Thermoanaerobaculia bacterium]
MEQYRGMLDRLLSKPARRPASLTLVLAGGLIAASVEGVRILFRNLNLFRPSRRPISSWNPADYGIDPSCVSEVLFESADGHMLHGWYCRTADPVASLLYCHGNTGNLTNGAPAIPALLGAGLNVFAFDYRGYGRSTGIPTIGGLIEDAIAAAEEHEKVRVPGLPSILFGYSLGGAVALQLSHRWRFDGLVLQSTFTDLREMARHRYPRTPIHYVAGWELDSMEAMRRVEVPTVVVHGSADTTVPSWMATKLFEASRHGRELVLVDGGAHTNLFAIDSARVVDSIRRLALRIRGGGEAEATTALPARARYPLRQGLRRLIRALRRGPATGVAAMAGDPRPGSG